MFKSALEIFHPFMHRRTTKIMGRLTYISIQEAKTSVSRTASVKMQHKPARKREKKET